MGGGSLRYRGREITPQALDRVRSLIKDNPTVSRRQLSRTVCEAWGWRQSNGQLCDGVCRALLLSLHRQGLLSLPPKKVSPPNPMAGGRRKPPAIEVDRSPIESSVTALGPIEILQVRRTERERLYGSLIEHYHYLGYCHPVGEQLKYVVFAHSRPIGCFAFSSAPRHLGPRDRFIGWSPAQRKANIHLLAYNTRFLLLPWVRVRCLASHLLGRISRRISGDWQTLYHHPIYLLETFVDTARFLGVSYRASNWIYLGLTTGRGKADSTKMPNRSLKAIWVYPLRKDFRSLLCRDPSR